MPAPKGRHVPAPPLRPAAWEEALGRLPAQRLEQAQSAAKAAPAAAAAGADDPEVFPGQPIARLSDYAAFMKRLQTGDMMGALAAYKLDMMAYAGVAQAWGMKLAMDPALNARFAKLMGR